MGSRVPSELGQEVHSVSVGEENVDHEQRDSAPLERLPGPLDGLAELHVEPGFLERLPQVHPDREAVVDDQDASGHGRTSGPVARTIRPGISPSGSTCPAAPTATASPGMP